MKNIILAGLLSVALGALPLAAQEKKDTPAKGGMPMKEGMPMKGEGDAWWGDDDGPDEKYARAYERDAQGHGRYDERLGDDEK